MKQYKKPQTEVYSVMAEDIMQFVVVSGGGNSSNSPEPIEGE